MAILTKEELNNHLREYYLEHFGERDSDEWFDPPAVNVCVFKREGKFYTLQSHILTGKVTVHVE